MSNKSSSAQSALLIFVRESYNQLSRVVCNLKFFIIKAFVVKI